ncbi:Bifunctional homocysteine S-methyltransferase/5,10-methylenetetrahydrofolate reductase [subsurface metagenome]
MGRISLKERISEGLFLLDGAMGTELIARGIEAGKCNDYLNIESADIVSDIQRAYIEAGSDAVITNTFGANKYALARHGLDDKVKNINTAGAQIARRAAGKEKYVLGDIGPSGDFLEPLGPLKADGLKDAFAQQAKALLAGGVDGLIIETMTALDEVTIAIEAVKSISDLPVFVSLSYDPAGETFRTMMGIDPADAADKLLPLGIDAIGFNCGSLSMEQYVSLAQIYVSETKGEVAILAEPNAGKPELVDDQVIYKVGPEDFAVAAEKIHSAGVNIIGGCCGTTPAHIEVVAKKLK